MLLDLALGIFVALLFEQIFSIPLFPLLWWALLFSIIVDFDFIVHKTTKKPGSFAYQHRDLLHYPLIIIPLGFLLLYPISNILAYAFSILTLLHFIHDSVMYGRGIKWLYPFSKNSYAFFYLYSGSKKFGLWQWVFIFNKKNLEAWDKEHADENWIKNIYFKLHPIAIIEIGSFLIALIALYARLT